MTKRSAEETLRQELAKAEKAVAEAEERRVAHQAALEKARGLVAASELMVAEATERVRRVKLALEALSPSLSDLIDAVTARAAADGTHDPTVDQEEPKAEVDVAAEVVSPKRAKS